MKKYFFMFLISTLLLGTSVHAEVNAQKAEDFIKSTTEQGLVQIINSNVSIEKKDARFEKLFNEALDLDFIGRFVLSRYWRTATKTQREEFINVYRQFNTKTWSKRFDEFKGKKFVFNGTSPSSSNNQIFVNTVVPMEEGEPAAVVWRVRQKGNEFKIVDIIIENVSLAITTRNEYTTFIKNSPDGVAGLIKDLKTKIAQE